MKVIISAFAAFVTVMIFNITNISAQTQSNFGTEFFIGHIEPSINAASSINLNSFYRVYLFISSPSGTTVDIYYYDASGKDKLAATLYIGAGGAAQYELDTTKIRMTNPGDLFPEYKSVRVVSRYTPISVQYFSTGACAGGSYLGFPTEALGKKYVVQSWYDNPNTAGDVGSNPERGQIVPDPSAGCFLIIAPYDGHK